MQKKTIYLILHNIRSAENVGSIFRSADAFGVSKIYCTGYTPLPVDRFGRKRHDVAKAALGAEGFIEWEHTTSPSLLIKRLKKERVPVIALEQAPRAIALEKFKAPECFALLLGNEVKGVPQNLLGECDNVVHIPMHGKKGSLNVAVAAGIALFSLTHSRGV